MKRYKAIFFDLDHTLTDTRRQYDLALPQTLQKMYPAGVPEGFVERFMHHHEALWTQYDKRLITMNDLRRERFLLSWKDFGQDKPPSEAEQFNELYGQSYETTLFPYPGTAEMLEALAQAHTLGIVTNGSPDLQWRKLTIAGLEQYFTPERVIISERVGKAKPHPSVYAAACAALAVQPEDALMIGDNYTADYKGALACGIDAIWYTPDVEVARDLLATVSERPIEHPRQVVERVQKLEQAREV